MGAATRRARLGSRRRAARPALTPPARARPCAPCAAQTVNLVGVGIAGQPPAKLNGVHWVYFPEEEFPFYRVTVLSNFSPLVVPKPFEQWSLLVEVSESKCAAAARTAPRAAHGARGRARHAAR